MTAPPTIVTAGEILVEFVSHDRNCGLERTARYSGPYPSGAPAIFIDQAARMGARTELIGGVGDDGFGRMTLTRLENDGVGTRGVTRTQGLSTGVAFVSYYDDGNRDFIFHLTNTAADAFAAPEALLDPAATWMHVSAASLGNAAMRGVILPLAREIGAAGGKVMCDPNARPELMRDKAAADALHEVMALAFCVLPSTGDLGFLYPGVTEEQAIATLRDGPAEIIIVKRGADGATVFSEAGRLDFPGHPVKEVDPTGAGDCFCGTFAACLSQGMALEEAARLANAAGAIAVTRHGPMEGNSGKAEIEQFLGNGKIGETTV